MNEPLKVRLKFDNHAPSIWPVQQLTFGLYHLGVTDDWGQVTQIDRFTGIKDEADSDIYENDWVKVGDKVMQVVFDKGCFYTHHGSSAYRLGGWDKSSINIYGKKGNPA